VVKLLGEGALGNKKSRGIVKRGGFSFTLNCILNGYASIALG